MFSIEKKNKEERWNKELEDIKRRKEEKRRIKQKEEREQLKKEETSVSETNTVIKSTPEADPKLCHVYRLLKEFLLDKNEDPDLKFTASEFPLNEALNNLEEMRSNFEAKSYKSTVILCGALIEVIIKHIIHTNPETAKKAKGGHSAPRLRPNNKGSEPKPKEGKSESNEWTMRMYLDTARRMNVLSQGTKDFAQGVWYFRNLVHIKKDESFDESKATACLKTLNMMCGEIIEWYGRVENYSTFGLDSTR